MQGHFGNSQRFVHGQHGADADAVISHTDGAAAMVSSPLTSLHIGAADDARTLITMQQNQKKCPTVLYGLLLADRSANTLSK